MADIPNVIEEVACFLVSNPSPEAIVDFHPSEEASARLYELIDAEREQLLSAEKKQELDTYITFRIYHGAGKGRGSPKTCTKSLMTRKRVILLALRQKVQERAGGYCEYCLVHNDDALFSFEADHIIAEQHRGKTELENLAWACPICNRYTGTNIYLSTHQLMRLPDFLIHANNNGVVIFV